MGWPKVAVALLQVQPLENPQRGAKRATSSFFRQDDLISVITTQPIEQALDYLPEEVVSRFLCRGATCPRKYWVVWGPVTAAMTAQKLDP